ncbi:MarR family winged helix-turn-helix transcriptional regulator [Alkalibacterium sp. MB6]|uniref:MarR family winged helix-turn-helix transcriptional regulator n=1 Tax=Alkalibacterium sp. MB6 TaxID=2081965 RepID=UPI00137B5B60|nr:winged helix DNA-binding protein [Alkalibacterium sp. MB6]
MSTQEKTNAMLEKTAELQHLYKRITDSLLTELGLSLSAINLIELIGDEEMTLKDITQKSQLDKSTISRQMNALVRKELVTKTTGEDKRFAYFKLTEKASDVFHSYEGQLKSRFHMILSGWTEEEIHMLTVLLGRLNRSIVNRLGK